ncbi:MAG: urea transporter, partial [Myxococcota bacterium]
TTRSGAFGYNALLIGLGGAAMLAPSIEATVMTLVAAAGSVLVTAALQSALSTSFALPVLTLPFLGVFYMLMGSAPLFDLGAGAAMTDPLASHLALPTPVTMYLRSLGAIFFAPRVDVGLAVVVALLVYSRIGWMLSVVGFALAWLMGVHLIGLPAAVLPLVLGYNFMLTAIALGGVWFVPSRASFLLAAFGAVVCGLVGVGLYGLLASLEMSLLILPFNIAVLLVLHAMRQRTRDASPKAVLGVPGTPEANLHTYQTRIARWGGQYLIRLTAPFHGRWVCTQSVDGPWTHQGPWRYGLDFEVQGSDGRLYANQGTRLEDYHCYRLPVTATAAGTVVKVIDHVADNPVGEFNVTDNWGNVVMLYHGPGLYSVVAHLSPGTVQVREGQLVAAGQTLGLCGNSGRSPTPHIHFHLQGTARLGDPTLAIELHNVIVHDGDEADEAARTERETLLSVHVPAAASQLRNIEPNTELAQLFAFKPGAPLVFEDPKTGRRETLTATFDLANNRLLTSAETGATLFWDQSPSMFVVYDVHGPQRSALHMIHAALARVPFEASGDLSWTDILPRRRTLPLLTRPLLDLVAPFTSDQGLEMHYHARQEGLALTIEGRSKARYGDAPLLTTRAELTRGKGLVAVEVTLRSTTRTLRRVAQGTTTTASTGASVRPKTTPANTGSALSWSATG